GIKQLELVVRSQRWEYAHAVWLDPHVSEDELQTPAQPFVDCLGRAEIYLPAMMPQAEYCIATVVSPGFEQFLDHMLGSLVANGNCQDALIVVVMLAANEACEQVAAKYHAHVVHGKPQGRLNLTSKSLLYSVAHLTNAKYYLCLDADMLILADLRPIFGALQACPDDKILVCREGNSLEHQHFGQAFEQIYAGNSADRQKLAITQSEWVYSLVVNDGMFAGSRTALLALDGVIRAMPHASIWTDAHPTIKWRNQAMFNLALARLQCGVELDARYNVQLHVQDVEFQHDGARITAMWRGRSAHVLHFSGAAKWKYREWQAAFAPAQPLVNENGSSDAYAVFVQSLRVWLGRHGRKSLTWSFYGLSSGDNASIPDATVFPLFATLHYLIRSNGCIRVLETGTARGVSAACLASAVAHREAGRVVTFDVCDYPERGDLWDTLPESMRTCIEARHVDSLTGMQQALLAGETYHAALLDSLHTAEHVWAEFQLATQLVCAGGLILIHDATYRHGTVAQALRQIEAAGYNVVRLWTAESGIREDDQLGLAIVENRRYPKTPDPDDANDEHAQSHERVIEHVPAAMPLVSCIMPTRNRAAFVLQSIKYFQRQTYPHLELIIVDDGDDDLHAQLPADSRIRYLRATTGMSIGAKRNMACQQSHGAIIAQWDDDDWYAPQRIEAQVAPILAHQADVCGLITGVFFDLPTWRFWRCTPALHQRLFVENVHGGTLVYRREVWQHHAQYPDRSLAEDAMFLRQAVRRGMKLERLVGDELFVYLRHASNSWSLRCGEYLDARGWQLSQEPAFCPEDRAFFAQYAQPPAIMLPSEPLISCIMPTYNRREFVPHAIRYFLRQDYANRELIIIDDGDDCVADLIPEHPQIRYVRHEQRLSVGAKRNLACQHSRGVLIAHWDDDDWHAPQRLSYQVAAFANNDIDLCGIHDLLFYDCVKHKAWQYRYPPQQKAWLAGSSLCYRREVWAKHHFANITIGEDSRFVWQSQPQQIKVLEDSAFHVSMIHQHNVSPKRTRSAYWQPYPISQIQQLLGADWEYYTNQHSQHTAT
ncbi:MAG: glycosyltransferase, partial [Herpetosiphon sp.]|nr:glycosyltransferase [Herpetosiphon sp.]